MMKKNILFMIAVTISTTFCLTSCVVHKTEIIEKPVQQQVTVPAIEQEQEAPLGQFKKCNVCDGKGQCNRCEGTGKINGADCSSCKGTGRCSSCNGEGGHWES